MKKRVQNIVAESRNALPITTLYAIIIWLMAGLVQHHWWLQFACFAVSVYLMVEFNSQNLLIRIFSRMVSCSYIVLTCTAVFLFPSLLGAVTQVCAIASLFLLFHAYQDKEAVGWVFYTFLCVGLGSLHHVQLLYYVPILWILMTWFIYCLSWRTFFASLLGLLAPYWLCLPWYLYHGGNGLGDMFSHLEPLVDFSDTFQFSVLSLPQLLFMALLVLLATLGTIHFLLTSYLDKIRVRQFYYSFIMITTFSVVIIVLQPRLYNIVIYLMITSASPLIAHFIALTHSRLSNITFLVITASVLILTGINLWILSSTF